MFGLGFLTSLHLSAVWDDDPVAEWLHYTDIGGGLYDDDFVPRQGVASVPRDPRLGRAPNVEVIRELTVRSSK